MLKKGDNVKFLNDVGGGVITRVIGKTVYVQDEEGFEIPALINDVVLVNNESKIDKKVTDKIENEVDDYSHIEEDGDDLEVMIYIALLKGKKAGDVSGDYRLYLVNDSNFFSYYTISLASESIQDPIYDGMIEPNTKELLDIIPVQFFDGRRIDIQMILFKKGKQFEKQPPIDTSFQIKMNQLFSQDAFIDNDYFDENAKLFLLKSNQLKEVEASYSESFQQSNKETVAKKNIRKRLNKKTNDILEIDLHINELLDDTRGLSNHEMLKIQLDKFHQVLSENKSNKGMKIVFIHGVGNGTLKQEILKLLKSKYKNLYYQDASFKEYGFGATMIVI